MTANRRITFLETSQIAIDLLRRQEVAERWDGPSALTHWKVSGLAGHLVRATTSVEAYLDRSPERGAGEVVSAARYYAAAVDDDDLESDLHKAIRQRGDEAAAGGHAATLERLAAAHDRLTNRLPAERPDRIVDAFKGISLLLDDYLVTRIVELCVHLDDLAVSVAIPTPDVPDDASTLAIEVLVEVARLRHGDLAVLRALTRRERDAHGALRVL